MNEYRTSLFFSFSSEGKKAVIHLILTNECVSLSEVNIYIDGQEGNIWDSRETELLNAVNDI